MLRASTRCFLYSNCRVLSTARSKEMSYGEERLIGYSKAQMYSIVENVAEYNQFVPWCRRSDVLRENRHSMEAELEIGFPPLIETYISRVTFVPFSVVHSVCIDDSLFRKLETTFRFGDGIKKKEETCTLYYDLVFEFKSSLHSRLAHLFFDQVVKTMVSAFLQRAEVKFGKPTIQHDKGKITVYKS